MCNTSNLAEAAERHLSSRWYRGMGAPISNTHTICATLAGRLAYRRLRRDLPHGTGKLAAQSPGSAPRSRVLEMAHLLVGLAKGFIRFLKESRQTCQRQVSSVSPT